MHGWYPNRAESPAGRVNKRGEINVGSLQHQYCSTNGEKHWRLVIH